MLMRNIQKYPDMYEQQISLVENKLKISFLRIFQSKLTSVFYKKDLFKSKNENWLQGNVFIDLKESHSNGGRPKIENFEECSASTKRRRTLSLSDSYSEEELKRAFYNELKTSGREHFIKIIENILSNETKSLLRFSEDESLALIEDAKLSK